MNTNDYIKKIVEKGWKRMGDENKWVKDKWTNGWNDEYDSYDQKKQDIVERLKNFQLNKMKQKESTTPERDDVPSVSESILDSIVEAIDQGATPDWLILKGDKKSKDAAKVWLASKKRIEARRIEAEKAKRKAELREQALAKLSDEEKAALGIK